MNSARLVPGMVLAGLVLLALAPLRAGEKKDPKMEALMKAATPGPEHKLLTDMAGTWDAKVKGWFEPGQPAQESTGTMTRTAILGGRFIQEKFDGKMMNLPFNGMAFVGYDNAAKKFQTVWIDSMGTSMILSNGTYDPASKTLTHQSEYLDPFVGKMVKGKDVLKQVSPNEQLFEMFKTPPGGQEFKVLEITFTKKK